MWSPVLVLLLFCMISGSEIRKTSGCSNSKCSHGCVLEGRVQKCLCPADLTLGPDSKTCQVPVTILLAMFRSISKFTEAKSRDDLDTVLPVRTTTFDYHYAKKEIFVYFNNSIQRYSFNDHLQEPSPPTTVVSTSTMVTSLAVDWVNDELYWISQQRSTVEAAATRGGMERVVASHDDTNGSPQWDELVIDPYARRLFWLDTESVYTSDLTGHYKAVNWQLQLEDIALDTLNQLVYVVGTRSGSSSKVLVKSYYDISEPTELFTIDQPGSKIYGFGILGQVVYWQSSHEGENLYKCGLPGAGERANITLVHEINQIVHDMKIYHPDLQKPMK